MSTKDRFSKVFSALTGFEPMPWQEALYAKFVEDDCNDIPACCYIPTGLGKTSVIAIWLIALANHSGKIPRRLVYVVNRRTVVDQTTEEVEKWQERLGDAGLLNRLQDLCSYSANDDAPPLAISTLRGQYADNQDWSADPSKPAVICGTVDMIGSRLLFSGYRIGFKSKPLHAGFLGQDVLLVHDEAHLEPAFQKLIETIEAEQEQEKNRCSADLPWPKLRVMAMSATARKKADADSDTDANNILGLTDEDRKHAVVKKRIEAAKQLVLLTLCDEKKELVDTVVAQALEYEQSDRAVLIFLRSVESVKNVADALSKHDKKRHWVETLTGTLRGLERDDLVKTPVFQRFLPESSRDEGLEIAEGTVYLVCTSAGEVGVNISADHMVCDLSTFDSMAQRFGRVNRFGDCKDTRIDVVYPSTFGGKGTNEKVEVRREKTLELLKELNGDASPDALGQLDAEARHQAFAPEPTILPATDILFDAWSLTTIRDKMPGRPPVEPYLHGVSDWEPPQTQVAWREEVDILNTEELRERFKPQDLLESYPLKPHELLRDRSDRVLARLRDLVKEHSSKPKAEKRKESMERVAKNRKATIWIVGDRNEVEPVVLGDFLKQDNKKAQSRIENCTVLLSPSLGGLSGGLLVGTSSEADDVADNWFESKMDKEGKEQKKQRRIRAKDNDEEFDEKTKGMRIVQRITLLGPEDDEDAQGESWYWYVRPQSADSAGWSSAGDPITWKHHTRDVVTRATAIVEALKLPDELQQAIILAAEFHDLGKKREQWQRMIGNPIPTDWHAKSGKDSVTGKRWKGQRCCPNYRHEFGSLLDVLDPKQDHRATFSKLSDDMQELVLHLIAAHHGYARPHFPSERTIDPERPQSQADEQAVETPRRFARLRREYGRWGLAYLESLLRAADGAASAEPSPLPKKNKEDQS